MSKKPNKKHRPNKLDPQIREIVSTIDKCRKKGGHGKIKIKGDKEQTAVMRGRCVHMTINKKNGRPDSTTVIETDKDGNRYFFCKACRKAWYPDLPTMEDVDHAVGVLEELNNRFKYLSVNLNIRDATKFTSSVGGQLGRYPKFAKSIIKVVRKEDHRRKVGKGRKNGKKRNGGGYAPNTAGAWYTDGE